MIQMHPLKRGEMQINWAVRLHHYTCIYQFLCYVIAFLFSEFWSYPCNWWAPFTWIRHRWRILSLVAAVAAHSTMWKKVWISIWWLLGLTTKYIFLTSGYLGLVSRFGLLLQISWPGQVQVNFRAESLEIVGVKIRILPIDQQTVMSVAFKFPLLKNFSYLIQHPSWTRDNVVLKYTHSDLPLTVAILWMLFTFTRTLFWRHLISRVISRSVRPTRSVLTSNFVTSSYWNIHNTRYANSTALFMLLGGSNSNAEGKKENINA